MIEYIYWVHMKIAGRLNQSRKSALRKAEVTSLMYRGFPLQLHSTCSAV